MAVKLRQTFLGDGVPKENMHCICIFCVTIDSVMRMKKENYPQVYLEECKYKVKKIQMCRIINAELESVSDSYSEAESDIELISKLKSGSGSDSEWLILLSIFVFYNKLNKTSYWL